jgi:glutathione S-transferase
MSTQLRFYTHPMSRARITRWMLEETGLPYEEVVLEYGTTMKAPEFLAINPMGKVPALVHNGVAITENAAICLHLADMVPELGLLPPPGTPERGACYRWMLFASPLEFFITARRHGSIAPSMESGYGNEADLLRTLEGAISGKQYLVGDRFTVADLYLSAFIGYYIQIGELEPKPVFQDYATQHLQRPASQRATAHDNELLAKAAAKPAVDEAH